MCIASDTLGVSKKGGLTMPKPIALLAIYDRLLHEDVFTIAELTEECRCSRRTCLRYLKDIRQYLQRFKGMTVVYLRSRKGFVLRPCKKA